MTNIENLASRTDLPRCMQLHQLPKDSYTKSNRKTQRQDFFNLPPKLQTFSKFQFSKLSTFSKIQISEYHQSRNLPDRDPIRHSHFAVLYLMEACTKRLTNLSSRNVDFSYFRICLFSKLEIPKIRGSHDNTFKLPQLSPPQRKRVITHKTTHANTPEPLYTRSIY